MSNEIDIHVIQATQAALSKYIKKPQLTEKLLRKPPFRFLHDLITNIIRETGFLKGLYSEKELLSENVKEKEEKIMFLDKLIEATKTITGISLSVKSSKIIAGFEPSNTNLLLQAIGMALDKKIDSTQYVSELKSKKLTKNKQNVKESKVKISKSKEKILKEDVKQVKTSKSTSKNNLTPDAKLPSKRRDSKAGSEVPADKKQKSQLPTKQKSIEKNDVNFSDSQSVNVKTEVSKLLTDAIQANAIDTKLDVAAETGTAKDVHDFFSTKPNSNSDIVNKYEDESKLNLDFEENKELRSIKDEKTDNAKKEKLEKQNELEMEPQGPEILKRIPSGRPKSSARPSSVRPSSARPGAPRLQRNNSILIKDKEIVPLGKVDIIDENSTIDFADEEETVTIEAAPEVELPVTPLELPADKGHLVEQILEQINASDLEPMKSNLNVEWEQAGQRNRNSAMKEVGQLQGAIQELTKMVNPLGKLINYLHEDIEAMHSELDMWNNCIRQTMGEISNQKKVRDESNMPLQIKLNEIEESIFKHQQLIVSTYSDILRNEERIQDLLVK